jgi:hypothetical protein
MLLQPGKLLRRGSTGSLSAAMLAAYSPGDGLVFNVTDNSLAIADPITPANNYVGPLFNGDGTLTKFTFTRASTATRINSAGLIESVATGLLRNDYSQGYAAALVEGQKTNLLLNSKFAGGGAVPTSWAKTGGTGTTTPVASTKFLGEVAYEMSAAVERPFFQQAVTTVVSTVYTMSFEIEEVSAGILFRDICHSLNETATTFYINGVVASATTEVATGDQLSCVWTATLTSNIVRYGLGCVGVVTGTCRISCPQVEAGSYQSSYIPTAGATVTRAADLLTISSSLFNLNSSSLTLHTSLFYSGGTSANAGSATALAVTDGTSPNRTILYNASSVHSCFSNAGGVGQALLNTSASAPGVLSKIAVSVATNRAAMSTNGGAIAQDLVVTTPVGLNVLSVGSHIGGFQLYGGVKEVMYLPITLSDAQLQALTS